MAKARILLLGTFPVPFESSWLPIGDGKAWKFEMMLAIKDPKLLAEGESLTPGESLMVDVESDNGEGFSIPIRDQLKISGDRVRARITEVIPNLKNITILLKEVVEA